MDMNTTQFFTATVELHQDEERKTVIICITDVKSLILGDDLPTHVAKQIFFYFDSVQDMEDGADTFEVLDYVNITTSFKRNNLISI